MMKRLLVISTIMLIIAGCGQKGPLYLPDQAQSTSAHISK